MTSTPSSVEICATTAVRDALPLRIGQGAFVVDSGSLQFYYGAYLGWRPPWNQPWGRIARTASGVISVTVTSNNDVEIQAVRTTFAAVSNRRYRFRVDAVFYENGGAGADNLLFFVYDGPTNLGTGTVGEVEGYTPVGSIGTQQIAFSTEYSTDINASHTIRVTASTTMPFGAIQAMTLVIDDVGPYANPIYPT